MLAQNNANLFWDNTNKRLGIGTGGPNYPLEIIGTGDTLRLSTTGATRTAILFDSTAGQQALLDFLDGGIEKFQVLKLGDNSFAIYSIDNAAYVFYINPGTSKNASFDPTATGYKYGFGTLSPGAQLNVTSAIEIFQTAALTAGSVGSLVAPIYTHASDSTITDAIGGNLNGCIVGASKTDVTATYRIAIRLNGAWKYATVAGFGIPNYSKDKHDDGTYGVDETICPLCHEQMKPKQVLGMWSDQWVNDEDSGSGLHAVAAHLKCLMKEVN